MTSKAADLAGRVKPEGVQTHIPQRQVFTPTSRPSIEQVATLTLTTAREVLGAVGGSLPDVLLDYAATMVEVGTAAKVERSFFPEQQISDSSPAAMLWAEFQDGLKRLVAQSLKDNSPGRSPIGMISTHRRTVEVVAPRRRFGRFPYGQSRPIGVDPFNDEMDPLPVVELDPFDEFGPIDEFGSFDEPPV